MNKNIKIGTTFTLFKLSKNTEKPAHICITQYTKTFDSQNVTLKP